MALLLLVASLLSGIAFAQTRPLPAAALEIVKFFEGWRADPYDDVRKFCTQGYGRLLARAPCSSIAKRPPDITREMGNAWLESDMASARTDIENLLVAVPLNDNQFAALISFVYNVGGTNFSKSRMLRFLRDKEYDLAGGEFGRWVLAGDKVEEGLKIRRSCEALLFRSALKVDGQGRFDPQQCKTLGFAPNSGPLIDIITGEQ